MASCSGFSPNKQVRLLQQKEQRRNSMTPIGQLESLAFQQEVRHAHHQRDNGCLLQEAENQGHSKLRPLKYSRRSSMATYQSTKTDRGQQMDISLDNFQSTMFNTKRTNGYKHSLLSNYKGQQMDFENLNIQGNEVVIDEIMFRAGLSTTSQGNPFYMKFQKAAKMHGRSNFLAKKFLDPNIEQNRCQNTQSLKSSEMATQQNSQIAQAPFLLDSKRISLGQSTLQEPIKSSQNDRTSQQNKAHFQENASSTKNSSIAFPGFHIWDHKPPGNRGQTPITSPNGINDSYYQSSIISPSSQLATQSVRRSIKIMETFQNQDNGIGSRDLFKSCIAEAHKRRSSQEMLSRKGRPQAKVASPRTSVSCLQARAGMLSPTVQLLNRVHMNINSRETLASSKKGRINCSGMKKPPSREFQSRELSNRVELLDLLQATRDPIVESSQRIVAQTQSQMQSNRQRYREDRHQKREEEYMQFISGFGNDQNPKFDIPISKVNEFTPQKPAKPQQIQTPQFLPQKADGVDETKVQSPVMDFTKIEEMDRKLVFGIKPSLKVDSKLKSFGITPMSVKAKREVSWGDQAFQGAQCSKTPQREKHGQGLDITKIQSFEESPGQISKKDQAAKRQVSASLLQFQPKQLEPAHPYIIPKQYMAYATRQGLDSVKEVFMGKLYQKGSDTESKSSIPVRPCSGSGCQTELRREITKLKNRQKCKKTLEELKMEQYNADLDQIELKAKMNKVRHDLRQPDPNEIEEMFKKLHKDLLEKRKIELQNEMKFRIKAMMGYIDEKAINENFKSQYSEFLEHFEIYFQSLSTIEMRHLKYQYLDLMERNSRVIDMVGEHSNDFMFKQQMKEAKPETKEFINSIVKTFEIMDLKADIQTQEELVSQKNENDTGKLQFDDMDAIEALFARTRGQKKKDKKQKIGVFNDRIKTMVGLQQNIQKDKRQKKEKKMDLFQVLKLKKKQIETENGLAGGKVYKRGDIIRRKVNYDLKAFKKFRARVCRNYLKNDLEFYENMPDSKTNVKLVTAMFRLKKFLKDMFPEKNCNIGEKVDHVNKNIFVNDFFYAISNEAKNEQEQQMYQLYFDLNDESEIKGCKGKFKQADFDAHHENLFNSHDVQEKNLSIGKMDIDNLFITQVGKEKFYKQIKKKNLDADDYKDQQNHAMWQYKLIQGRNMVVPNPGFLTFSKHILVLSQQRATEVQAEALRSYLCNTGALIDQRVYKLIIESCHMDDESFSIVLNGLFDQCVKEPNNGKKVKMQHIQSLIYSNNEFGCKSLDQLKPLIPHMFELQFNNVHFSGGKFMVYEDEYLLDKADVIEEILDETSFAGTKLMKLKLSKINLKHSGILSKLGETLIYNQNLLVLDVSMGQLMAKQLNALTSSIAQNGPNIRHLNLSYNQLNFAEANVELQDSLAFMTNIAEVLKNSKYISHVNFSGMNFQQAQILTILELARCCPYMLGIHLSDNGITNAFKSDQEFFYDCLEPFQITDEDLIEINRSVRNEVKIHPKEPKKYDKLDIDYEGYLNPIFKFECQDGHQDVADEAQGHDQKDGKNATKRRLYKDRLLLSKEYNIVRQFKAINETEVYYGLGRKQDLAQDRFVLTRFLNQPGLVFNQRIKSDYTRKRFFNIEQQDRWSLSKDNGCYICQKYQYTLIFYDRSILSNNEGLIQIQNEEFLKKLQNDFNGNYSKFMSTAPLICGTLINRGKGQPNFDRKLKMIQAPLYAILQMIYSKEYNPNMQRLEEMAQTIDLFLQNDSNHLLKQLEIDYMFRGWEKLLKNKCTKNELMDIKTINPPDWNEFQHNDYFVFGDFLKPGYHQLLIYDPLLNRAYCKDFVVNLNQRDVLFPEYPMRDPTQKKKVANVWRKWLDDSQEDVFEVVQACTARTENFLLHRYIKDQVDAGQCVNLLVENFDVIKIYQKHLQFGSKQWPKVDWERIWQQLEIVNETISKPKEKIEKGRAELCFIRACRQDDQTSGLRGGMQRFEFFEFVLRLAKAWVGQVHNEKEKPFYDSSIILEQKNALRADDYSNQFLYDNRMGLSVIFNIAQEHNMPPNGWQSVTASLGGQKTPRTPRPAWNFKGLFTFDSALWLFEDLEDAEYEITQKKIEQCFQFCPMTVLDEVQNSKKYYHLEFVEFLDMLCRICIVGVTRQDTLDYNLHFLLEILYEKMYRSGSMTKEETPLYPVEENLR